MQQLLKRDDVDPNIQTDGWTPLTAAARNGHEAVVRLLLNRNDANPIVCDPSGWTALTFAAYHGHEAALVLLLIGKAWWHEAVIRLLCEGKDTLSAVKECVYLAYRNEPRLSLDRRKRKIHPSRTQLPSP